VPSAQKTLPRLALPLIVSFTLRFSIQTVDLVYAALLDDPSAVAAIAFWIPFHATYVALWVGLSAGFTACLSNAFGHRDESRVKALGRAMLRLMGVLVPVLSACGVALWFLVPTFGLDHALTESFRVYGTTMLIGLPLTGFWSIWPDSVIKAHHDTVSTMVAGLVAAATNIVLNSLFVFGCGLGLFGIALATVV
jgi:Na+-driven multidrug efflux pump